MEKVLVAGATGYLGRFVVQEFKKRGYWIRALVRNPQKLEKNGPFLEPAVKDQIDEIFVGEVTKPETLRGLCEGIDIIFSSIGITRQRDKVSFMDVDYQGNRNLLERAKKAAVKKFIFVSVFKANKIKNLATAREMFIEDLKNSGLDYAVIRPTGYFSDMSETLKMAQSGRVYLFGDGEHKINPIHGADLASVCADAAVGSKKEIPVGGPDTYSHLEIAELAFSVLGKARKITRVPMWIVNLVVKMIWPFSKHYHTIASFFAIVMQNDFDAPKAGHHSLKSYYEALASQQWQLIVEKMNIKFYGYNTFLIESGDKKIAIDPGATFLYFFRLKTLIPKSEWEGITHIFVTHGDPDHYWHMDRVAKVSGAQVICNQTMIKTINGNTLMLGPRNKGLAFTTHIKNLHPISVGETIELDDMSVTGLKATHGPLSIKFGPFSKTVRPGPEERVGWGAIGFNIQLDGKTVINLGDTLIHIDEWGTLKNPDVLMIPIGGKAVHNTMDEEEALQVVKNMHPKLVIPCHYNCPAFFSKKYNPADERIFKKEVEKVGIRCALLHNGESINIEG